MLQVKRILVGIVGTNCYIVYDKDTKEAVVIDPGAEEERIISFIEEEGLKPEAILQKNPSMKTQISPQKRRHRTDCSALFFLLPPASVPDCSASIFYFLPIWNGS